MSDEVDKGGRPPKYDSVKDLEDKIDEYFDQDNIKPTITGLCLFLGFADRQSFRDYGEKPKFSCTIKKAHTRIEQKYEDNLCDNNVVGSIFALKNLGWKDKTESEITLHSEQPIFKPLKD